MFATTAFGSGVDYSGVQLVIHAGLLYLAIEYVQETGRAGRYGLAALCVALVPHCWRALTALAMHNSWHAADYQKLEELLGVCAALVCQWQVLTAYLDGNAPGTSCDTATLQPCDVCRGNDEAMLEDATGAASLPPSYVNAGGHRTRGCAQTAGATVAARLLTETLAALAFSSSAYTAAPRSSLPLACNWRPPPTRSPLLVLDASVPRSSLFAATHAAEHLAPSRTTSRCTSTRHSLLQSADEGDVCVATAASMASAQ